MTEDAEVHRRVLLAERDVARRDRSLAVARIELAGTELKLELEKLQSAEHLRQIACRDDQMAALFASLPWRLSAPVRRATALVNRLRTSLGGHPATPLPGPAVPATAAREAPPVLSLRERAILDRLQRPG